MNGHYRRSNPLDTLLGLAVIALLAFAVLSAIAWAWDAYSGERDHAFRRIVIMDSE
ncbi:hypothetical protein QZM56_39760 [Burkholderia contaminans]|uniref:Uncharacterized protein n=1 Tax=Burkholderia contaminans TaxID=488447 RepID=A0AAP4RAU4_9BURK|nr:hypothetical protein [Burkholderia contaminans]MDN7570623.1 hypothetical protein [Burkholderia contaminans]